MKGSAPPGCGAIFPKNLQAATGAGVFAYSRAGYGASTPGDAAAPARLHARRGARRAAETSRRHRLSPRAAGRPFRRRVDRGDLCRRRAGSPHPRAGADRAAFHRRGYFGEVDRRDQDRLRDHRSAGEARALAPAMSTTRSTAGTAPGSTRNFATGIFRNTSPISACRSRSCRAPTTSMGRCARSRSRRKNAIVRSTSRSSPVPGIRRIARRRRRR